MKGPMRLNGLKVPSGCASRSAIAHKAAGVDAEPRMAREHDLNVFRTVVFFQQAGAPMHDTVSLGEDRCRRDREVAG